MDLDDDGMGLLASKYDHAGVGALPGGRDDRGKAQTRLCRRPRGRVLPNSLTALLLGVLGFAASAEPQVLRIAFYHLDLSRDGPGLPVRDLMRGTDPQIAALVDVIAKATPDILVVQGLDWDLDQRALLAFQERLADQGLALPVSYFPQPNRGLATGIDLDGDGRLGTEDDVQSFGKFTGANGLALLSRYPLAGAPRDYTTLLWRSLPDALLPIPGAPVQAEEVLRLSTTTHALVPVEVPQIGPVWVGMFAATAPAFDGPEDRNGRRNHDEVLFWARLLEGALDAPAPMPLVLVGNANLDPARGDGRRAAIQTLLSHPDLQDPAPRGDAGLATVEWPAPLGRMRVAYVLPDRSWRVVQSGVIWPGAHDPWLETVTTASRHRLVWVDLAPGFLDLR